MAVRCTTPAAAMHHFCGMGAPFQRWRCTIICGQAAAMHHFCGMGAPFQRWRCTIICGQAALLGRHMHLCPAASCGWHTVGQQKVHEYEALRDDSRRRLYCWLTLFCQSLQINLRISRNWHGCSHRWASTVPVFLFIYLFSENLILFIVPGM